MNGTPAAWVFDGPGKPLRLVTVPQPPLGPGERLARVRLCTLCASDLHTFAGRRHSPVPTVLGHEILGELDTGERVVWSVAAACGACFFCERQLPQKCERLLKYGHEPLGRVAGPFGGLATHVRLAAGTEVVAVPPELPDAVAAPTGCATATVAAAVREAGELGGRTVVIFGAGMLGLTAAAWAKHAGATAVVVVDPDAARLWQAERFGATVTTPGPMPGLGRGADVAIEVSGAAAAIAASVEVLRIGGRAVWLGAVRPTPAIAVDPEAIVRRCLSVTGVHNYRPDDLRTAVQFLTAVHKQYPFAELVERVFPFADVPLAMDEAERRRPVRVGVCPE